MTVDWVRFSGQHVSVFAPAGSQAAELAPGQLREAERSVAMLETMLGPPDDPVNAVIYLVDPISDLPLGADAPEDRPLDAVGPEGVVRVAQEEAVARPIAEPLTRLVISRWYGERAQSAGELITGIAGLVAARTGTGPSAEMADEWVRGALRTGRSVSILGAASSATDTPDGADALGRAMAATSFVAFLAQSFRSESLRRFLAAYDPDRRDEAAISVYRRPLALLEEAWRTNLARPASRGTLRQTLAYLITLLRPHRLAYAEVLAWQALAALLALALPVVSGCVVGTLDLREGEVPDGICRSVAPALTSARLSVLVAVLAAVYVLRAVVLVRRGFVEGALFTRIGSDLKEQVFTRLHRLPQQFHRRAKVADLVDCVSNDTEAVQAAATEVFGTGVSQLFVALAAVAFAVTQSPIVGVLFLLVLPLLVTTQRLLGERTARENYRVMVAADEATVAAQESLQAQSAVKAFGLEDRVVDAYSDRIRELFRLNLSVAVLGRLYEGGVGLAGGLAQLAILAVGAFLAIYDHIDAAAVVTLLLLLPGAVDAGATLAVVAQSIQLGWGPMEQVKEVLEADVELEDRPNAQPLGTVMGDVQLYGVSFSYEPGRPVLRGLDLTIPAGSSVAIVGASGAGKSTIANLLLRFWDPDEGAVLIDGHDVQDVTQTSLRGAIGLVAQETFVFNTTMRDNVGIGRRGATDAEIEAACRAARFHDVVMSLPAGYDTVLGEHGARLSGGERQRLAIARAILRDPAILILDEPTSALDARVEAEIVETLQAIAGGRTTIAVTQRPALALAAERIFVLERGRIVEQGTHHELITAGGPYQRLYESVDRAARAERSGAIDLAGIRLLAGLDATALERLAEEMTLEQYDRGDDIVCQGEVGDRLYFMRQGSADVFVTDGSGTRRVRTLRPGDYFGELALLTRLPRSATVRAAEAVEALSLGRGTFLGLLDDHPVLRDRISQLVFARRIAYDAAALATGITSIGRERIASDGCVPPG